ncbi:MAG: hypothetical protein JOY61_20010 [Chloroflexi bacterium]|nr:hypothetical protein [Chloroflexota bacterium]
MAGDAPDDVWAVGNFLPDAPSSNQDATLTLAMHFDGNRWISTPTPDAGPIFNTLFGVAAAGGHAWGVGAHLNRDFNVRGLIETWDPAVGVWHIADSLEPGPQRDLLFGASASSASDAWAVGEQQNSAGKFGTLVERWNGRQWQVVPSPDPGASGNHLNSVLALGANDVWAVGQRKDAGSPDHELVMHWNGSAWWVLPPADHGTASAARYSMSGNSDGLWAVGETTDPDAGGHRSSSAFGCTTSLKSSSYHVPGRIGQRSGA